MNKENLTAAAAALKSTAHRLQALAALAEFRVLLDAPAIARSLIVKTHESLSALYASSNQLQLALAPQQEQKGTAPCPENATTTALPEAHSPDSALDLSGSRLTKAPPSTLKMKRPANRKSRRSG